MRSWLSFACEGASLAGALDEAVGNTGLLIVSGGNELLSGSHGGMASLAARVATAGHPVFRYDRRGVGDSEGSNGEFESAAADLAVAVAAFRAEAPSVRKIIAFGNCDAATSLGLFHGALAIDAVILSNPWVIEAKGDLPPPAAIAARYRDKLTQPSEWLRLLRGGVDLGKLVKGLLSVSAKPSQNNLVERLRACLASSSAPLHLIVARRDATALAFEAEWRDETWASVRQRATVTKIDTSSHSYASKQDADALFAAVLAALASERR